MYPAACSDQELKQAIVGEFPIKKTTVFSAHKALKDKISIAKLISVM